MKLSDFNFEGTSFIRYKEHLVTIPKASGEKVPEEIEFLGVKIPIIISKSMPDDTMLVLQGKDAKHSCIIKK